MYVSLTNVLLDLPNSVHAFQTAEQIRKAYPSQGILVCDMHKIVYY